MLAPPPRLSITICWPRTSPSRGEMSRASRSVPPPATNGTIIRTGRTGYASAAHAPCIGTTRAAHAKSDRMRLPARFTITPPYDSRRVRGNAPTVKLTILLKHLPIDLDPQPRPLRHGDDAAAVAYRLSRELGAQRVLAHVVL